MIRQLLCWKTLALMSSTIYNPPVKMISEFKNMIMKCYHCTNSAFRVIDGTALCSSCYTDFQSLSNNQVSSAYQAHRGMEIANSMLKARVDLQRNQNTEHQIKIERTTEVNNYNTHNNITVQGDNNGTLQAGKTLTQNNDIGITNLSKAGNDNIGWLAKIINKGMQIAKFCMKLIGFFR